MSDFFDVMLNAAAKETPSRTERGVAIYGAGGTGKKVLNALRKQGTPVIAFLDEFSKSTAIEGVPVRRLSDPATPRNVTVIVAVFNRERNARYSDIRERVQSSGYTSIFSFEQFYLSDPSAIEGSFFWLSDPSYLTSRIDEVKHVDTLWADQLSRTLYREQLLYRLTGDQSQLHNPTADTQYLPPDVPMPSGPHRFIDVGAFDGDTLDALSRMGVTFERILAFEPDMMNFRALIKRVREHGPYSPQTILIPCGVGRTCASLPFEEDGTESAKAVVSLTGTDRVNTKVPIVSLDEVAFGFRPTYIKFDVEGFEEEALYGMKNTIEAERPMLAVSVYHKPCDLFQIPLLLASWDISADFYLRSHGEHAFETVLYMIPHASGSEERHKK
jgi:FkbM family methyltransferase